MGDGEHFFTGDGSSGGEVLAIASDKAECFCHADGFIEMGACRHIGEIFSEIDIKIQEARHNNDIIGTSDRQGGAEVAIASA